jgi:hypothetical protein
VKPTASALAPRLARNWPLMLPAPSYVKSAKRLAMPIKRTKLKATCAALGWLFLSRTVCGADSDPRGSVNQA